MIQKDRAPDYLWIGSYQISAKVFLAASNIYFGRGEFADSPQRRIEREFRTLSSDSVDWMFGIGNIFRSGKWYLAVASSELQSNTIST